MNKVLGKSGEDQAAEMLAGLGYKILARNYRTRYGEIDIIAEEGKALVFIEVKARSSARFGSAKEAVNWRKTRKLRLIIRAFVSQHKITGPVRFEVVAIQGGNAPELISEIDFSELD